MQIALKDIYKLVIELLLLDSGLHQLAILEKARDVLLIFLSPLSSRLVASSESVDFIL